MTLEELREEAHPIIEQEQRQEKENRDNFFKVLAGQRWQCATPNYCPHCRYRYDCRQSTVIIREAK